jgi:hypothetical protein
VIDPFAVGGIIVVSAVALSLVVVVAVARFSRGEPGLPPEAYEPALGEPRVPQQSQDSEMSYHAVADRYVCACGRMVEPWLVSNTPIEGSRP